jgi:hypothetical protein
MKPEAVCLRCGAWKIWPAQACPKCGFAPEPGTEDELRSVYLSTLRAQTGADARAFRAELEGLARVIASGEPVEYDRTEFDRLNELRDRSRFTPSATLGGLLVRFVVPALLILAAFLVLAWMFR